MDNLNLDSLFNILFIKRADNKKDRHKGEIALPGNIFYKKFNNNIK